MRLHRLAAAAAFALGLTGLAATAHEVEEGKGQLGKVRQRMLNGFYSMR